MELGRWAVRRARAAAASLLFLSRPRVLASLNLLAFALTAVSFIYAAVVAQDALLALCGDAAVATLVLSVTGLGAHAVWTAYVTHSAVLLDAWPWELEGKSAGALGGGGRRRGSSSGGGAGGKGGSAKRGGGSTPSSVMGGSAPSVLLGTPTRGGFGPKLGGGDDVSGSGGVRGGGGLAGGGVTGGGGGGGGGAGASGPGMGAPGSHLRSSRGLGGGPRLVLLTPVSADDDEALLGGYTPLLGADGSRVGGGGLVAGPSMVAVTGLPPGAVAASGSGAGAFLLPSSSPAYSAAERGGGRGAHTPTPEIAHSLGISALDLSARLMSVASPSSFAGRTARARARCAVALRVTGTAVIVLSILGVWAAGLVRLWLGSAAIRPDLGEVRLPGLTAPVTVSYSREGVAHILADKASPEADGWYAQGAVHARDRLWQIEFQRRVSGGRLSELVGKAGLDTDKLFRVLGLSRAAERDAGLLANSSSHADAYAALAAYCAGVNDFVYAGTALDTGVAKPATVGDWARSYDTGYVPLEMRLLGVTKWEAYTPAHALGWAKVTSWGLAGNLDAELQRYDLLVSKGYGPERVAELRPPFNTTRFPTVLSDADLRATFGDGFMRGKEGRGAAEGSHAFPPDTFLSNEGAEALRDMAAPASSSLPPTPPLPPPPLPSSSAEPVEPALSGARLMRAIRKAEDAVAAAVEESAGQSGSAATSGGRWKAAGGGKGLPNPFARRGGAVKGTASSLAQGAPSSIRAAAVAADAFVALASLVTTAAAAAARGLSGAAGSLFFSTRGSQGDERHAVDGALFSSSPQASFVSSSSSFGAGLPRSQRLRRSGVSRPGASNNWVVGGAHTQSGLPLLANDPHLQLLAPSLWYLNHIQVDGAGLNVVGASFVGAPGVVIGRNARVAWAVTNTGVDVQDTYVMDAGGDATGATYVWNGTRVAYEVREETIAVKGEDSLVLPVRVSRYGPVITDFGVYEGYGSAPLSLRWVQLDAGIPDTLLAGVYDLQRARDWTTFRAALRSWTGPSQNFMYADSDGHIGYQMPGSIPVRNFGADAPGGVCSGAYPSPGNTPACDWLGVHDFDTLPRTLDPPEGFLVSANNAVVGPSFPVFLTSDWDETNGYRAARIRSAILDRINASSSSSSLSSTASATAVMDTAGMAAIQGDVASGFARDVLARGGPASRIGPNDFTSASGMALRDRLVDWASAAEPVAEEGRPALFSGSGGAGAAPSPPIAYGGGHGPLLSIGSPDATLWAALFTQLATLGSGVAGTDWWPNSEFILSALDSDERPPGGTDAACAALGLTCKGALARMFDRVAAEFGISQSGAGLPPISSPRRPAEGVVKEEEEEEERTEVRLGAASSSPGWWTGGPSSVPGWGSSPALHSARMAHAILEASPLACMAGRSVQHGGDDFTPNVGGWELGSPTYEQTHGPSYRQIVDLSDDWSGNGTARLSSAGSAPSAHASRVAGVPRINSFFVQPLGQRGDPLGGDYDSMVRLWGTLNYVEMGPRVPDEALAGGGASSNAGGGGSQLHLLPDGP